MSADRSEHVDGPGFDDRAAPVEVVASSVPFQPLTSLEEGDDSQAGNRVGPNRQTWRPDGHVIRAVGKAAVSAAEAEISLPTAPAPTNATENDPSTSNGRASSGASSAAAKAESTAPIPTIRSGSDQASADHPLDHDVTESDEPAPGEPAAESPSRDEAMQSDPSEPDEPPTPEAGGDDSTTPPPEPPTKQAGDADEPEPWQVGVTYPGGVERHHTAPGSRVERLNEAYRDHVQLVVSDAEGVLYSAPPESCTETVGRIWGERLESATMTNREYKGVKPHDLLAFVAESATEMRARETLDYCMNDPECPREFAIEPSSEKGYSIIAHEVHHPSGVNLSIQSIGKYASNPDGSAKEHGGRTLIQTTHILLPSGKGEEILHATFYTDLLSETTVARMSGQTQEQARVIDTVAEMVPMAESDAYIRLSVGAYENPDELARDLSEIREAVENVGLHTPERINEVLGQLENVAQDMHFDRSQDDGIRPERFWRVIEALRNWFGDDEA